MPPELIDQLRDIHGIASVPWWPLAPGWWLLLFLAGALLLGGRLWRQSLSAGLARLWLVFGGWRGEAIAALHQLREDLPRLPPREIASALSPLVRRIAMARHGRAACAGLHGDAWLAWLTARDPAGFDWRPHGAWLAHTPYAPVGQTRDDPAARAELAALLVAAEGWVRTPGGWLSGGYLGRRQGVPAVAENLRLLPQTTQIKRHV